MRITIVTLGSRGDIQPYIALGKGLKAAGHDVKIATHDLYCGWITAHCLRFAPIYGNPREIMEQGSGLDWLETGQNGVQYVSRVRKTMQNVMRQIALDTQGAIQGADLIIASALGYFPVSTMVEETGQPWIQTFLQPIHPTPDYPPSVFPTTINLGGWFNSVMYTIGGQLFWQMLRPDYNRVRREDLGLKPLGLTGPYPAIEQAKIPALYAYSPSFLPKPDNWKDHYHVTGYWFLDEGLGWQPPDDLQAFLDAGDPPVYVGFGSMSCRDPADTACIVVQALEKVGQRGVLLPGWQGLELETLPDSMFVIKATPHDWLFPRMAAVVHHGGAGTTAAGLRAGRPTVIVPFFSDQPWWGQRVYEAGVGPKTIQRKNLTADRLAAVVHRAVTDEGMQAQAAALGEQIRSEDGIGEAVRLIGQYLNL